MPPNVISVHASFMCYRGRFINAFSNAKETAAEKTFNRFLPSGMAVSTKHMSPYNHHNVCKKCATTSLHLWKMTFKALGIIDSVINFLLPTFIFWKMKQNQKNQYRSNIIPLVECLPLDLPTTPECFVCEKFEIKDADRKTERHELFWF